MKTNHLSKWEQEEYLLEQRSPQMMRHLSECADCRDAMAHLQQTLGMFRTTALEYSAHSLAERPRQRIPVLRNRAPLVSLRWAFAALVPLLLVILALLPLRFATPRSVHPVTPISDDALLDQVDEQLSVAVPSSMESLTHLVTTESGARSESIGQSNVQLNVQSN